MSMIKQASSDGQAKSPSDEYLNTLSERLPQMRKLFEILGSGVTPDFLDIMRAISEMVAFYTDCDQISDFEEDGRKIMSQKKCRFCS